jgi:hypothetical protein
MMRRVIVLLAAMFLLVILCQAQDMKPLNGGDLIVVERYQEAPTIEEAKKEASRLAMHSCVGRVYFSNKLILARPLLSKYIDNYFEKFVNTVVTDDIKHLGDRVQMNLKIFVDYSKLIKDLEEKGFIFTPRIRPLFVIFLEETLDGQTAEYQDGYNTIRDSWKDLTGQRMPEKKITIPPPNMNVCREKSFLSEAVRTAQKNGAEVIITGTSSSVMEKRSELYFDTYAFFRTDINLKIIRADNLEVIGETTVSSIAGSTRQSQAIKLSITRAARKAVYRLSNSFKEKWDKSVLGKCDYFFLFTGVNDEKLDIIKKRLESLDSASKVFVKSRYADIAIMNLEYKGNKDILIETLEESAFPRMLIRSEKDNRFEIQMKN